MPAAVTGGLAMLIRSACVVVAAFAVLGATSGLSSATPTSAVAVGQGGTWVGSWEAAPLGGDGAASGYANYSIRDVVHSSAGGRQARIRLSNRFGTAPVTFGHVTIGVQARPNSADASSVVSATFHGAPSTMVPTG